MRLTFLGSGGAFTLNNFHSNMLLEHNGKRLLIDAGGDVRRSLAAIGLSHRDLDAVYISHCHGDHCDGLEWLSFITKLDPRFGRKLQLFAHPETLGDLRDKLSPSISILRDNCLMTLDDYFDIVQCSHVACYPNNIRVSSVMFEWQNIEFYTVEVEHLMLSYGLWIPFVKTFITSDTRFTPEKLMPIYKDAKYIFHDCETLVGMKSGVHSHFNDLKTLAPNIKSKMHLYHYSDGLLPDADDFAGFVNPGQIFDLT